MAKQPRIKKKQGKAKTPKIPSFAYWSRVDAMMGRGIPLVGSLQRRTIRTLMRGGFGEVGLSSSDAAVFAAILMPVIRMLVKEAFDAERQAWERHLYWMQEKWRQERLRKTYRGIIPE
jgi:hypothetical protein